MRVRFGAFVLDRGTRQLLRGPEERRLRPKAFELLELLLDHRPNVVARPRVRQPVLMLNGRYDSGYPVELLQKPLFRLLGTPEKDKRHVLVDSGHSVGRSLERARETLDWLDRYLGPVDGR